MKKGEWDKLDNPPKNAPHTADEIAGEWKHAYPFTSVDLIRDSLDIESAILLLATYTNTSRPIKPGIIKIRKINMMLKLNLNSVFSII